MGVASVACVFKGACILAHTWRQHPCHGCCLRGVRLQGRLYPCSHLEATPMPWVLPPWRASSRALVSLLTPGGNTHAMGVASVACVFKGACILAHTWRQHPCHGCCLRGV